MAYLKDWNCECCGHPAIWINSYRDPRGGPLLTDGGECQICFKRVVLPDASYLEFVQEFGTRKVPSVITGRNI